MLSHVYVVSCSCMFYNISNVLGKTYNRKSICQLNIRSRRRKRWGRLLIRLLRYGGRQNLLFVSQNWSYVEGRQMNCFVSVEHVVCLGENTISATKERSWRRRYRNTHPELGHDTYVFDWLTVIVLSWFHYQCSSQRSLKSWVQKIKSKREKAMLIPIT